MTDEDLEAVDMESNLDGSEYSDGDTMEPMDGDYSSADFETGVSDESMDAAIDGDYTDFSEDFSDEDFIEDDSEGDDYEDFTDESIDEPGQYGSDDTEAAG